MTEDTHEMLTFHPLGGIGDVNSQEKGSGARFNAGKPDFSLIPMTTLEDEARVWMYGRDKYSQRGDCTCSAGNAARMRGTKGAACVAGTMKGISDSPIQSTQSGSEQIGAHGTPRTPSELKKLSASEAQSEASIRNTRSSPSTGGSMLNTALVESNMTHSSQVDVQSAAHGSGRTLTTATPPELLEVCYAIPATLALDFSKGLKAGLVAHSPTCGVHTTHKTAAWNWTKGMQWSVPFACAMRHMAAWQRGEECDPESGLPHLAHAMCNLRMLTLYATNYPQGDDRPTKELQP